MSDRASAAPPPSFLGPGEIAAYERQFYDADRPRPLRPVSSAGHYSHHERDHLPNPLAHSRSQQQPPPPAARKPGFWDGMRERFFLSRSKSSSVSDHPVAAAIANPLIAPPPPPGPAGYPTRDQVLASYQTLVSSGFFESHAIHGTRHPPPPTMMGPPPRPVSTPHPMPVLPVPSPQRGTKRPTPADNDGETGARKLVKKLRRSASRISVDLAVSFSGSSKPNPPRPSTSSHHTGRAASFISSAASSIYEHPEPELKTPAPKKKLTKPMPPMTAVTRGRRQGGWRDRSRSRSRSRARPAVPNPNPNPLAMNPVVDQQILHIPLVDDAMLLDQETPPRPSTDTLSGHGTVLHPPPPSRGRATERRAAPPRKAAGGPLSVVPDANRGIPGVPRIPEGLMRGGLSPAKEGGVFGFRGKGGGDEDVKMGGRDSGLGEEVEMDMGVDENRGVVGVGW